MPSKVSFHPQHEVVEPSYELTRNLQQQLWFQEEEMDEIRATLDEQVTQIVSRTSLCVCERGLETQIRERLTNRPLRKIEYADFVSGLTSIQSRQQAVGHVNEEGLRKYCCKNSKRHRSLAHLVGTKDAKERSRIFKENKDWKLLMPPQQEELPSISSSKAPTSSRELRRRSTGNYEVKQNLFTRITRRHSGRPFLQASGSLIAR